MAAKSAAKSKETLVSAAQSSAAEDSAAQTSAQKTAQKAAQTSAAQTSAQEMAQKTAQKTVKKPAPEAQGSAKTTSTKKASAKTSSAKAASAKKSTKKETTKATAAQKEQARKARAGAQIAGENAKATGQAVTTQPATLQAPAALATADPSELVSAGSGNGNGIGDVNGEGRFLAAHYTTGDIWVPNAAIPALDEATYQAQKTQAEGQRRAIEVASLNLQNINGLQQLERQNVEVAISAKTTETRAAELTGAEIDYQWQVEQNGEKSEHLMQASAKREAATRETGYTQQLIALKDQNFELEIQQAQTVFAEKAARYRAQLTGQ